MAQTSMTFLIALGFSGNLMMPSHANEFLKTPSNTLHERVSEEDIRVSLLDEVEGSLGKGSATGRLSQIEAALRPIVAALPKNGHGNLEGPAVSYALHRLFVLRHGWVIKGLGAEAIAQNASSPTGVLKDQVPSFIEGMFEQRLAGKGFGLHELSVLAATIEHLIHNEAVSRLGAVFNVHKLPVTSPISKADATEVLDTYMMAYILGENLNNMTLEKARQLNQAMPEVFLAWGETQKFVDYVRKKTTKESDEVDGLDFASLAKVVEAVGEEYGTFQDFECRQMKDALVKMEYHGTGRVRLSDFYRPALEGVWTFQESSGYLRSLGALDESDPSQPSVMMANYINSHSNCIASSGFYSVCCKNECEGLLGHLEDKIGASEAKPATIAAMMSNVPSPSTTKVSSSLLQRLDDIAATHAGTVPLHGRLFAQWMHHVYPRECPYPHVSGTTTGRLQEEWMAVSGDDGIATEEEMKQHVARSGSITAVPVKEDLAVEDLMPWSDEEELIIITPATNKDLRGMSGIFMSAALRSMALLAASCSLAFGVIQTMKSPLAYAIGNEKYMI